MSGAESLSASGDPLIGRVVQDRYRVDRAIGRGGMGVVYEAEHVRTGRKVAIKLLASHASVSSGAVERFHREAQAAASVGNSHIVDVLDMGELDRGSLYIVLEHLNGMDLGFAVAFAGRFPLGRAVDVLGQLCDALSAVHAKGIVHRDLKPENVFLIERDGKPDFVKVLDFGICKVVDSEVGRLTASGDTLGTPQFMAPEQIEGRSDIDHRTDIHALGTIFYFLLTGRAPFEAPTVPKLLLRICNDPVPSIHELEPSLPIELDAILQRALHKNPDARYESCEELKAALQPFARLESASTLPSVRSITADDRPFDATALVPSLRPRWPLGWSLGVIGAVAVVGSVIAVVMRQSPAKRDPATDSAPATSEPAATLDALAPAWVIPPPPSVAPVPNQIAPEASAPAPVKPPSHSHAPRKHEGPRSGTAAPSASAPAASPVASSGALAAGLPSAVALPAPTASAPASGSSVLTRGLKHGL